MNEGIVVFDYIYIYIYNRENNVPSWLSPKWLCGNSCTWAHDVYLCKSQSNFVEEKLYFITITLGILPVAKFQNDV